MFTGLTNKLGKIVSLENNSFLVKIETSMKLENTAKGSSIMCSGICLTAVEIGSNYFIVNLSEETLRVTTAKNWRLGTFLNLEKSLKVGDELGGHFVSGHVDDIVSVLRKRKLKGSFLYEFSLSNEFHKFIVKKGSVAIDGVSLTVNDVNKNSFSVNIIPHTYSVTSLGFLKAGDKANFEIDLLARYIKSNIKNYEEN